MADAAFADEHLLFQPTVPDADATSVIFAFPNDYTVGITSLGYQIVWATLAQRRDLAVSRLFTDCHEPLPSNPALLGFSPSWELDYGNLMGVLESLAIPLWASDRGDSHPLVFGGGPVLTANPEPFADFFDLVLLGDGENLLDNFVDAYQRVKGCDRATQLRQLAQVPGVYVPSLYAVTYSAPGGPVQSVHPIDADVPATVQKQTYRGNVLSASTVVTSKAAWESIYMVEVVRSCPEMCRFCLASYLTLPFRVASVEGSLIPAIERGLQVTNRLGLLGASVTQHPEFEALLDYLNQPAYDEVRVSMDSVEMMLAIKKAAPGLRLTLGCSTFVPKSHTPFQWFGVNQAAEKRLKYLQKQLRSRGIDFRPESYNWSVIQALISRGARRLARLLERVRHYGDSLGSYRRAFKDLKGQLPPLDFYVHETWPTEQPLPWDHLQGPLPKPTLIKHLSSAFTEGSADSVARPLVGV